MISKVIQVRRFLRETSIFFESSYGRFKSIERDLHVSLFYLTQWLTEDGVDLRDLSIVDNVTDEVPSAAPLCQFPPTCFRRVHKGDFCEIHVCVKDGCSNIRDRAFHTCTEH